jgi:membrane protease YdiL (CAAX protease family)
LKGEKTLTGEEVNQSVLPIAALTVLLNSVTQEVLLRGYILQTLRTYLGTPAALLLSSATFVVLHFGATGSIIPTLHYFLSALGRVMVDVAIAEPPCYNDFWRMP